jgi:predicted PurR-regulated permease PerM
MEPGMKVPLIGKGLKTHAASVVVGVTVLFLGIGLLTLIWLFIRPLGIAFLGVVIAQALMPIVARLEKWMPRVAAIAVIYVGMLVFVIGLGWLVAPSLVEQVNRLIERLPELTERVQDVFNRWNEQSGGRVGEFVSNAVSRGADVLISLPVTITGSVLDLFFLVFTSIYWLTAAPSAHKWFLSLFPERRREEAADILGQLGRATGGYVRGEVLSALMIGGLATAGLWIIGFDYPIVGGIISAIGEIFPIIGPVLAAFPVTAMALLDSPT